MWMCVSQAGLTWAHPCVDETSTSADVEMASGVGSSLLDADAPGEGQLCLEVDCGVMGNLSSQKIELVTADKFGGKLSLLLFRN